MRTWILLMALCCALCGCSDGSGPSTFPADTGADVEGDVDDQDGADAQGDAEPDAAPDAEPDAEADAGCPDSQLRCGEACVPIDTVEHCGSCAGCTPAANQAAACVGGACVYECEADWVDADGDAGNGCECAVVADPVELCDGVDNDCNGEVDEADLFDVCPQVFRAFPASCAGADGCVYECGPRSVDVNGDLGEGPDGDGCECQREAEVCDGVDNDCDGLVDTEDDDFVECPDQAHARATCDGACLYECADPYVDTNDDLGDPEGDGCDCAVQREVCDGMDNDCDGLVDAEDEDMMHECEQRNGVCSGLLQQCVEAELLACTDEDYAQHAADNNDVYQSGVETWCDGEDNDCDSQTDEDCCEQDDLLMLPGAPNGSRVRPVLAGSDSPNLFFVAWQDTLLDDVHENAPRSGQVRWARTNFRGIPLAEGRGVADDGSISPAAAWTVGGWTLINGLAGTLRWRRIAADGELTHQASVLTNTDAIFDEIDVAHAGDGRTVAVWTNHRARLVFPGCMGVRCVEMAVIDADGTAGEAIQLTDPNINREHWYAGHPSVAVGADGALIAWAEDTADPHKLAVIGLDADLRPRTEFAAYLPLPDREGTWAPAHPEVLALADGYAVFFEAYVGDFVQIMVQRYDAAGVVNGDPQTLTEGAAVKAWPQVAALSDGGFTLAFVSDDHVVHQRLDDDLDAVGPAVTVLEAANPAWDSLAITTGTRNVTRMVTSEAVGDVPRVLVNGRQYNELGELLCLEEAPQ